MDWQPIESAPAGEWILVRGGEYENGHFSESLTLPPMMVAKQEGFAGAATGENPNDEWGSWPAWLVGNYDICCDLRIVKPTHWMPLPEPPQ
jgi:hypothetical protein